MNGAFFHSPFAMLYLVTACTGGGILLFIALRSTKPILRRAYLAAGIALWVAPIQFVEQSSHGFVPALGAILAAPFSPLWATALALASLLVTWLLVWAVLSCFRFPQQSCSVPPQENL